MVGFYDEEIPKGRCSDCEYKRIVYGQNNWSMYACFHAPYHGKWVAEIKDCPIGRQSTYKQKGAKQ